MQCLGDFERRQFADRASNKPLAQIVVWRNFTCRHPNNRWVIRQVHRVGDDGGGGVSHCHSPRQNGNGIGNAERKTATTPAAGGDTAGGLRSMQVDGTEQRWTVRSFDHANLEGSTRAEMESNIAAIVYVGSREIRGSSHRFKNFFGHGACNRSHWCDEML